MTKRLYLDDSYVTACETTLTCMRETGDGYLLEFEESPFYPTGGGQPHDTGMAGAARIRDVYEEEGRLYHLADKPLEMGGRVRLEVDWARRFDHMQQHAGEHLISFAAKELFGAVNVGFHMAAAYCTVDFDMPFTAEQAAQLEVRANALVCLNLPVLISFVEAEALEGLRLRKQAKGLSGRVRIVHMPGGDSCTCCGTHVKRTGEIGLVKITGAEHYKGGERLTFACGARALHFTQRIQDIAQTLALGFSCKMEDVPHAVMKQQQELSFLKRDAKAMQARLNAYLAQELFLRAKPAGKAQVLVALADVPPGQLRPLALAITQKADRLLALVCAQKEGALSYVLCCSKGIPLDMGELTQAVNAAVNGKGGGRGTLAQGSGKYGPGTAGALEQLEAYLQSRLKTSNK